MPIKPFFLCLFSMSILYPTLAIAESLPQSAGLDSRVQVFDYSPNDVYVINAQAGYASLIQLEDGEFIHDDGGLGMGLADSWNIAVKGNNIFFKPISPMPDTNLILVTNKRTYAFVLTSSQHPSNVSYIARFNYPVIAKVSDAPVLPEYVVKSHTLADGRDVYMDADFNKNYLYRGADNIKPTHVWDNGRFTYLKYSHASDLPVAYRVLPDNSEMLVNTHIEDDTLVLQEIGAVYRLRLGNEVGEIGNQYNRKPKFNVNGTSDKAWQRVDIQGQGQ